MARVVLHPNFQRKFAAYTKTIPLLWKYNDIKFSDKLHMPVPYTFETYEFENSEHLDLDLMAEYRRALAHSLRLWIQSESRDMLRKTIIDATKISAPITRILCFGLGRIQLHKGSYESAMQHMAVFDVARTLRNLPDTTIEIALQDPMYEERDWILLKEMHRNMGCEHSSNLRFLNDPDGLLAITSSTLVVTAFLVVQYPLLQIISDIFAKGSGPAAILCDNLYVDPSKKRYTIRARESPAVARMLYERYVKLASGFEDHELEEELREDMYGVAEDHEGMMRRFWLPKMDFYVRKKN
jgi:hypothetical protein